MVATAGGRPVEAISGAIPSNARIASYLPFEWLLPRVDVLVTNGGYGSVNQAMSCGIPLVTAGMTEDKADVNARVAWSGVGIDLATNEPTADALRNAVRNCARSPRLSPAGHGNGQRIASINTRSGDPLDHQPARCGSARIAAASQGHDGRPRSARQSA